MCMAFQVERPWDWVANFFDSPEKWAEKSQENIGIGAFGRAQCVRSFQRPSPKSKPLTMNSHGLSTWTAIVWSLQRPSPKSKPKGATHFNLFLAQINPSNLTANILSMIDSFMKGTESLSTIVWVSIPIQPKLASRIRRLLQKLSFQIVTAFGLWP